MPPKGKPLTREEIESLRAWITQGAKWEQHWAIVARKAYAPSREVLDTQSRPGEGWGESSSKESARRSVYMFIKRSLLSPLHTAFDFPDVDTSCEARFVTVQPGQALTLLNGEFANTAAVKVANRVTAEVGDQSQRQVPHALELVLGRPATRDEVTEGLGLIARLQRERGLSPRKALQQWCLVVLNMSEFTYID
jgi:hypothetical protein